MACDTLTPTNVTTSYPSQSAEVQACELLQEWKPCECCANGFAGYDKTDGPFTYCINGTSMIATPMTDAKNCDDPQLGSRKAVPTWELKTLSQWMASKQDQLYDASGNPIQGGVGGDTIATSEDVAGAVTAANNAQTAANAAQTTANAAQGSANAAQTSADAAQTTANAANTAAGQAQTTANQANTAANQAATLAASAAQDAQQAIDAAEAADTKADQALAAAQGGDGPYSLNDCAGNALAADSQVVSCAALSADFTINAAGQVSITPATGGGEDTDSVVTGGTFDGGTDVLTLTRSNGLPDITISLAGDVLLDDFTTVCADADCSWTEIDDTEDVRRGATSYYFHFVEDQLENAGNRYFETQWRDDCLGNGNRPPLSNDYRTAVDRPSVAEVFAYFGLSQSDYNIQQIWRKDCT